MAFDQGRTIIRVRFSRIIVDADAEEHIARHGVRADEVRQVAATRPLVRRARKTRQGRQVYAIYGPTAAGRYLFVIVRAVGQGSAKLVTARSMDDGERRLYLRSRR